MRPGCCTMLELQSVLLCILLVCSLQIFVAQTKDPLEIRAESGSRVVTDLGGQEKIHFHLFRRNDQMTKDLGPQRPPGQHPPVQLISNPGSRHLQKPDDLRGNPRWIDLGPHRPGGQVPPNDNIRLTPLEILSVRKLGQRLSNRIRRDIDIGPHRPGGQHPIPDVGPQRPSGQSSPNDSVLMRELTRQNSAYRAGNQVAVERTGELVFFQDEWRTHRDIDVGPQRPNGQFPPSTDLGPQRPNGQHPPEEIENDYVVSSNTNDGQRQERFGRDVILDSQEADRKNDEPILSISSERCVKNNFPDTEDDTEVSPYTKIIQSYALDLSGKEDDTNGINSRRPQDLGPHRPIGSVDPSGVPLAPDDLGPPMPSGQHPPSSEDLGPQRPSGQHPESAQKIVLTDAVEGASEKIAVFHSTPSDLGPHRPSGATDPNGIPSSPSDLSPQRPSGQHPPSESASQGLVNDPHPGDLGPHRPNGATDPNGLPSTPSDLGPQRPSGQHPPSEGEPKVKPILHYPLSDLGPQRPIGAKGANRVTTIFSDLGPSNSASQRVVRNSPANDLDSQTIPVRRPSIASQKLIQDSSPNDTGPHRPSGNTDPNGTPSPPSDLGPQRPSGQHLPSTDDLGPQRPSGQHPPESAQKIALTDSVEGASEKIAVFHSTPTDLGPHRPSGATDPNGIPSPPSDLGPQRPSGQHPPSTEDLGPQRPSGQHPPESAQKIVLTDAVEGASKKIAVFHSTPTDLGPHRPRGATDPNGIPSPPSDLGPQRPSGQHRPESEQRITSTDPLENASQKVVYNFFPGDIGPLRPSGATVPNVVPLAPSDLGPQRPSGQHPPSGDSTKVILLHAPSVDLGPHRPSGDIDPNGPPIFPADLGPQRPSGQHPPRQDDPLRVEAFVPIPSIDLGPHRPAGLTDPNIKPGIENDPEQSVYNVYWNIPTFMCHKHGFRFRNLSGEYGVVQNPNDAFRGPRLTILYDPGLFPAVLQDEKGKKFLRNGGVPQEGDLQKHLAALEDSIEEQVPKDFDGLGVIDFEAWRPVWAQNWGALNIYRTVSMDLEKRRDPSATRRALEIRAKARFEAAARVYFEATVQLAQQLRPRGRWGFYGFPHCFNQVPTRPADYTCAQQHQRQNDKIDWLWKASTALYPSVYLTKANKTAQDEFAFVSGRLVEAKRVAKGSPVYAYVWYRYHDSGSVLTEDDLWSSLSVPRRLNLAGTILWGSSSDLNSRDKCAQFSKVLQDSIGPAVARATGRLVTKTSASPTVVFAT